MREEWGRGGVRTMERGIYRGSIYSRERYRVRIGIGKEDKEYIEGNREKKCPGETRRSFFSVSGKDRGVSA